MNDQTEKYLLAGIFVLCVTGLFALSLLLNRPLPESLINAVFQVITGCVGYMFGVRKSNGVSP